MKYKIQQLQKLLLAWMVAIVDADNRVSDGEAVLISRALERWMLDLVTLGDARMSVKSTLASSSRCDTCTNGAPPQYFGDALLMSALSMIGNRAVSRSEMYAKKFLRRVLPNRETIERIPISRRFTDRFDRPGLWRVEREAVAWD